jgi:hypothetical protein
MINPSFIGIVSFHGDDQIMSISRGGEPDFEEFNLSSLYWKYQDESTITAVTWISLVMDINTIVLGNLVSDWCLIVR